MKGWAARFTALFLIFLLSGCLSVRTQTQQATPEEGGIAVTIFLDDAARRDQRPGPEGVLSELERKEGGTWKTVFRSVAPRWVLKVSPGRYRLRFPARITEEGHVVSLKGKAKKLVVQPGQILQVEAVLEHLPAALVVVGVAVAAVVVVALSKWLRDADLPEPPLPPPLLEELTFDLTLGLLSVETGDMVAPVVTSHFPANDALVPAGRIRIIWVFSEALAPASLDPQKIRVLGEKSGLLPGVASYDANRWWVIWESREPLHEEQMYATLDAGAVEDLAGNELQNPSSVRFRVR